MISGMFVEQTKMDVRQSIAYLKGSTGHESSAEAEMAYEDQPVVRPISAGLHACYLIDHGDHYDYVQNRDLKAADLNLDELHKIGLTNLSHLAIKRSWKVQPNGSVFAFLMGGDFEASILLVDDFWNREFRLWVRRDYAVAIPSRDVLAFCDAESDAGIRELQALINRVWPGGDHLISHEIYIRRGGEWDLRNE